MWCWTWSDVVPAMTYRPCATLHDGVTIKGSDTTLRRYWSSVQQARMSCPLGVLQPPCKTTIIKFEAFLPSYEQVHMSNV